MVGRLAQWDAGERISLWDDLDSIVGGLSIRANESPEQEQLRRQESAMAYAAHGAPGKAVNRLVSQGLAADTPEVLQKMISKFPPPTAQRESRRPRAPAANILSEELIARGPTS